MLGSEVNALICAFNRLYVSMCRYSSTEINIFPGDCEKLDIEPHYCPLKMDKVKN